MKKTITFLSRRAAMMLFATLLLTLTAQTAWAEDNPFDVYRNGGTGDLTITTSGGYDAYGTIDGNLIIQADVTLNVNGLTVNGDLIIVADGVTLDVNGLTVNGNIQGAESTLNVNLGLQATDIQAGTIIMNSSYVPIEASNIEAHNLTVTSGTITTQNDITVHNTLTVTDGTINASNINAHALNMSGGIITCYSGLFRFSGTVSGGTINASSIDAPALTMTNGTITCYSGPFSFSGTVSGGTIKECNISARGGTISGGTLTDIATFSASWNSPLTISGGIISAAVFEIFNNTTIDAADPYLSLTVDTYSYIGGDGLFISNRDLIDGDGTVYDASATAVDLSAIAGKTLRPAYKVTIEENGGSEVSDKFVLYGSTISDPGSTKTGYTATWKKGEDVYNFSSPVTEDFTLTATWTANTYSVRFNKNSDDASGTMDNQSFTYDEAAKALTANDFTRTGYTFVGWATTANGAVAYTDGQSVQNLTAEANVTIDLYAKWIKNIPYIDENGDTQTCTDYTLLRTDNPEHLNFSNLPGGWYVVENWTDGVDFSDNGTLHFQGDTHLILCDEAEMSVNSLRSIGTLTIYGQSGSSGAINIYNESTGINASKDLTINGGIISVSSDTGYPIDCGGNVVINGGRVTATTSSQSADAIFGVKGVVINGGKVTATAPHYAIDGKTIAINGGTVIADGPVGTVTITEQMIDLSGTNKRIITESIDGDVVTALQTLFGNNASVSASFKRTFKGGVASTICLPFPMTSIDGGTVYGFVGVTYDDTDGWVATMIDTSPDGDNRLSATEVNTPYLFKSYSDGTLTFTGKINTASITAGSTPSTDTYWTFNGTYSRLTYSDNLNGQHIFGFAASTTAEDKDKGQDAVTAGEFVKAIDGAYFPAFRAYLAYTGNEESLKKARGTRGSEAGIPETITVRLIGKNGEIDGIGEIRLSTGEVTFDSNAWYDLNGRKLTEKPTQKGIYINNGHKIAIK